MYNLNNLKNVDVNLINFTVAIFSISIKIQATKWN
jgi:hypothetical protein